MSIKWRIHLRLTAWMEHAEPADSPDLRLLAEDDAGEVCMPSGYLGGEPYWKGLWCWWKPAHWPVYIRSRLRKSYVMVERVF